MNHMKSSMPILAERAIDLGDGLNCLVKKGKGLITSKGGNGSPLSCLIFIIDYVVFDGYSFSKSRELCIGINNYPPTPFSNFPSPKIAIRPSRSQIPPMPPKSPITPLPPLFIIVIPSLHPVRLSPSPSILTQSFNVLSTPSSPLLSPLLLTSATPFPFPCPFSVPIPIPFPCCVSVADPPPTCTAPTSSARTFHVPALARRRPSGR